MQKDRFDSNVEDHRVTLIKDGSYQRLGMNVRFVPGNTLGLLVTKVEDNSLTFKWNAEHPSEEICIGDHIVEINGITGDPKVMMQALTTDYAAFDMVIRRTAAIDSLYSNACETMRFRTLGPKDFELMEVVDRALPSKTSLRKAAIGRLPRVRMSRCEDLQCSICLNDFEDGERATQLPCKHCFCTKCISKWLSEDKNQCPQCRATVTCPEVPAETKDEAAEKEHTHCSCSVLAGMRRVMSHSLGATRRAMSLSRSRGSTTGRVQTQSAHVAEARLYEGSAHIDLR
jgi:hypothetical protein